MYYRCMYIYMHANLSHGCVYIYLDKQDWSSNVLIIYFNLCSLDFESLNVNNRCNFAYITVGILFILIINRMQFLRDYMITEIKKKKQPFKASEVMWVYNRCFEKISLPFLKILLMIWRVNITFYKKNYQFHVPDHIVCGWDSLWMRKLKTLCLIVLSSLQNGLWQKAELKWKFEKKSSDIDA